MSNILISPPPTTLLTGLLQLQNGVAISSTPVYVTDQNNTASPLALATANVNVNTTSGSALVNIKGTGTTSSSNSLIVQNSAGTSNFSVRDDGLKLISNGGMQFSYGSSGLGIGATNTGLVSGTPRIFANGSDHLFIEAGNTTNALMINSPSGNVGVGIYIPTARLNIKGSGSTSATTSLLVQDSAGTNAFYVRDDRFAWFSKDVTMGGSSSAYVNIGTGGSNDPYINAFGNGLSITTSNSYGANSSIMIQPTTNWQITNTTTGTGFQTWSTGGSERMRLLANGNVGIGTTTATSKLHIKGNGTTSSTTSLIVDKSDGNTSFLVRDDAQSIFYGGVAMNFYNSTQLLAIKGSGTTSATTNTNITNSSGTQLIKVTDDGKMTMGTGTTGTALLDVSVGAGSTPPLRLKGYSDAGTSYLISAGTESFADNFKVKMVNGNVTMGTQLNGYTFGLETFNGVAMHIANAGNIGMGTTSPNVSAKLEVNSTTQGFLPPVMTTAQKTAIGSPSKGLIVFDSSLNKLCVYSGTAWETITSV